MNLRVRLVLYFLVAAFVPLVAFGVVVQTSLVSEIVEDHARRLATRVASAQRAIESRTSEDQRAVNALCEHDLVIDRVLLSLAAGDFGPAQEQELVSLLPPLMRGRGFETLHLVLADGPMVRGRILGAAHYPGQVGSVHPELLDALSRSGGAPFAQGVRVQTPSGPEDQRSLLTGCVRSRDGVSVAVIAGRVLGPEFGTRLIGDVAPVHFALVSLNDEDAPGELLGSGEPTSVYVFNDARGEPLLELRANIDDAPLLGEIARLQQRAAYVAGAALALALLMSILLSWTVTRPFLALQEAAKRVGQGDLESQVSVGRRDEVGSTMAAFNDMTRELAATQQKLLRAERIAAWREVARRIAHEIKNPLQPIQMEIETMRKMHARKHPAFDEEFEPSTQLILDEVKRLDHMVTEFSRFARLPRPKPVRQDLSVVVRHVANLHESDETVVVELLSESVSVRFDREQLTQVLINLVQNAVDAANARHGGHGGKVQICLAPSAEGAIIEVRDNGPGIPLAERVRVFEPYFTTKSKGTGLGLAIVHRIVGDHGGSVDIEDGIDGGASFVIRLPESGPPEAIAASLSDGSFPLGRPQ